jgi:hypothetical protein
MKNKIIILLAILLPLHKGVAQPAKSDKSELLKDFSMYCEISKMRKNLLKTESFKADEIDLAARMTPMVKEAIKTPEVKNVINGLSMGDKQSRENGWHQAAKDLGLKNWSCPGIGG